MVFVQTFLRAFIGPENKLTCGTGGEYSNSHKDRGCKISYC
ncbi:hypothetical protein LEP1GSC061_0895 [Leptospira wolffii serovar Khorat str. Khorat-H2]|nr:hypothetical protein LEP1GSC061_0895 [Leptospira wolffii serovar Khorat str. Khorat-H2]